MAFLRLSNRRVAARKSERKRADRKSLADERDAWLAQRQAEARNPQARMLGKTFATRKKAAEFGKRLLEGQLVDGKAREARSFAARGKASMAVKKDTVGPASGAVRVRPVNGIWRRYMQGERCWCPVGKQWSFVWRWVSDHASMEAALDGREPLNEPE